MSLGNLNFDDIAVNDLNELINVGVPEGLNIDYKRDLYGNSDNDKKEILKDISSFANSFGGHLIIGIEEANGIPIQIPGLQNINPDNEILRIVNITRDGIEPRITGLRIKAIQLESGNYVLVIRIPRSWNPPHQVSARNINKFYVRNSGGTHEVSVEELRALFNLSASVYDRIHSFRRERLSILSADEGPMRIGHEGRLVLHIVPFSAFGHSQSLNIIEIDNQYLSFSPISSTAMNHQFNFDGVINYRSGEICGGYTQIFRNGIIEATKADILRDHNGQKNIPSLSFDQWIFEVLPKYLNGLRTLGVPPPLVVMISLQEIAGALLGIGGDIYDFSSPAPFRNSELLLPEIMIEDYGTAEDYQRAMRPAFDALWNSAGYAASQYFNDDNLWVGRGQ